MHSIEMKSYILEKISEIEEKNIEITKKIHDIRSYIIEEGFDLDEEDFTEKSWRTIMKVVKFIAPSGRTIEANQPDHLPDVINITEDQYEEFLKNAKKSNTPFSMGSQSYKISGLIKEGIETDGAHHKQWYLEKIADLLNIDLPDHDPGVAP